MTSSDPRFATTSIAGSALTAVKPKTSSCVGRANMLFAAPMTAFAPNAPR